MQSTLTLGPLNAWPRRWEADWISWEAQLSVVGFFDPEPARPDRVGYLRRTFALSDTPSSARCRITADSRYQLFMNGTLVGRGPVRSEPSHITYDSYDLTTVLRTGVNAVAVLVRFYGSPTLYWKPAPMVGALGAGGILFEADVVCGDGHVTLRSDGSWRGHPAPYTFAQQASRGGPPALEIIDGRAIPHGWTEAGFDDSAWPDAVVLRPSRLGAIAGAQPTEPYGLLGPRPIPHLSERTVHPVKIVGRGSSATAPDRAPIDAHEADAAGAVVDEASIGGELVEGEWVTLDFGEIVGGHPIVELDAEPGTVIDITCGEDFDNGGRAVAKPRNWAMRYTAAGGDETVTSLEPVGLRYAQAIVRSGSASRVAISALERKYPRAGGARFSSSDPTLDAVWTAGVRTLDLCSTDAYLDCPGREQRAWLGDAYIHTLVSFVCSADADLARWNVRLHAQGARSDGLLPMVAAGDFTDVSLTIPDYSLHWVRTLARVLEHTGDHDLAVDLLPVGVRALDWFEAHRNDEGLLTDLEGWIFIDWAQNERGRQTAAIDALYVLALDDMAMLARLAGDDGLARRCTIRAERSREAFEAYWDAERSVYVDARSPDGDRSRRVSQHTNALAILSGCAASERYDAILDRMLDTDRLIATATPGDPEDQEHRHQHQSLPPKMDEETEVVLAQPFFAHFVHQAVAHADRGDLIADLCRRWRPLVERGNGCLEEYWTAGPGLGSRCHAWSATPTYDLTTHVLGIRPGAPEWASVIVEPHLGDLSFVEGVVPTTRGEVRAAISKAGTGYVELPPGTSGTATANHRTHALGPGRTDIM